MAQYPQDIIRNTMVRAFNVLDDAVQVLALDATDDLLDAWRACRKAFTPEEIANHDRWTRANRNGKT